MPGAARSVDPNSRPGSTASPPERQRIASIDKVDTATIVRCCRGRAAEPRSLTLRCASVPLAPRGGVNGSSGGGHDGRGRDRHQRHREAAPPAAVSRILRGVGRKEGALRPPLGRAVENRSGVKARHREIVAGELPAAASARSCKSQSSKARLPPLCPPGNTQFYKWNGTIQPQFRGVWKEISRNQADRPLNDQCSTNIGRHIPLVGLDKDSFQSFSAYYLSNKDKDSRKFR